MRRPLLLDEQVRQNKRRTAYIFVFMGLMLLAMVLAAGLLMGLPWYASLAIGLVAALVYLLITAGSSTATILRAARARPANPQVREEKLLMFRVEELAIAAGIPPPKVYVQESRDINAFAAGRNPQEAVVCFTTGALQQLKQEELEGVVAHELSHIKNYDVRLATITLAVVGAIALLAEIVLRMMWYGGRNVGGNSRGGGAAVLVLVLLSVVFIVLAPIVSRLVYFALSRRREYQADATGAMLTRNPDGLASALEKILNDVPDDPKGSRTISALYLANPYLRRHRDNIWATHPPLEKRIALLRGHA